MRSGYEPSSGMKDLVQVSEMFRQVGGELVRSSVGVSDRAGHRPILLEEAKVVTHRPIVEFECCGELVRVGGRLVQLLEDPQSIRAPPRTAEEIPHQRAEPRAHHAPGARGPLLINRTSPSQLPATPLFSERGEPFGGSR